MASSPQGGRPQQRKTTKTRAPLAANTPPRVAHGHGAAGGGGGGGIGVAGSTPASANAPPPPAIARSVSDGLAVMQSSPQAPPATHHHAQATQAVATGDHLGPAPPATPSASVAAALAAAVANAAANAAAAAAASNELEPSSGRTSPARFPDTPKQSVGGSNAAGVTAGSVVAVSSSSGVSPARGGSPVVAASSRLAVPSPKVGTGTVVLPPVATQHQRIVHRFSTVNNPNPGNGSNSPLRTGGGAAGNGGNGTGAEDSPAGAAAVAASEKRRLSPITITPPTSTAGLHHNNKDTGGGGGGAAAVAGTGSGGNSHNVSPATTGSIPSASPPALPIYPARPPPPLFRPPSNAMHAIIQTLPSTVDTPTTHGGDHNATPPNSAAIVTTATGTPTGAAGTSAWSPTDSASNLPPDATSPTSSSSDIGPDIAAQRTAEIDALAAIRDRALAESNNPGGTMDDITPSSHAHNAASGVSSSGSGHDDDGSGMPSVSTPSSMNGGAHSWDANHEPELTDSEKRHTLLGKVVLMWLIGGVCASWRYAFQLPPFDVAFIWLLIALGILISDRGVASVFLRQFRLPRNLYNYGRHPLFLGMWVGHHKLRSTGWMLLSFVIFVVSGWDCPWFTERQRLYSDDVSNTASPVWLTGLVSGAILLGWMVVEYSVRKVQDWTAKLHRVTSQGLARARSSVLGNDDDDEHDNNGRNAPRGRPPSWPPVPNGERRDSGMLDEYGDLISGRGTDPNSARLGARASGSGPIRPRMFSRRKGVPLRSGFLWIIVGSVLLFFAVRPFQDWDDHSCPIPAYNAPETEDMESLDYEFDNDKWGRVAAAHAEAAAPRHEIETARPTVGLRAVHPKAHGCVHGTFRVSRRLPPRRRVGMFEHEGREFPAWVRFSNANHNPQDDAVLDVRGMAVKLMGVDGPKMTRLDPDLRHILGSKHHYALENRTHDFLLSTAEIFPFVDPSLSAHFFEAMSAPSIWPFVVLVFPQWWNPTTWQLGLLRSIFDWYRGGDIKNPLTATYYSGTPYRFGPHAAKYSFRPCRTNFANAHADKTFGGEFLRENMRARLDPSVYNTSVCFELYLQRQAHACKDPLEDVRVAWTSEWHHLGTLTIKPQRFLARDQMAWCEALSFNPFQALLKHAPLGNINKGRALGYAYGAAHRTRVNRCHYRAANASTDSYTVCQPGTGIEEPRGDEWQYFNQSNQLPNPYTGAGDTMNYEYSAYPPPFEHLPRKVKEMPEGEGFGLRKFLTVGNRLVITNVYISFLTHTKELFDERIRGLAKTQPEHYSLMVNHKYSVAGIIGSEFSVHRVWRNDAEFARQYMSGVHPVWIRLCTQLPTLFDPDEEELGRMRVISDGVSIDELMRTKRLFIADYEILDGIDMVEGRFFYAPIVLLFVKHLEDGRRQLMPLAIQLTRNDDNNGKTRNDNEVYTPPLPGTDFDHPSSMVWLFARMHAACADGQIHQSISHLGMTHLAMEPVVIAFYRQLAKTHPLFAFMRPHFDQTLAINVLGRRTLLAPGKRSDFQRVTAMGLIGCQQLIERAYQKSWSFAAMRFPAELASRGFERVQSTTPPPAAPAPSATPAAAAAKADGKNATAKNGTTIPAAAGTAFGYDVDQEEEDILPGYLYRDYGFLMWDAILAYTDAVIRQMYGSDAEVLADTQLQALITELYDPDMGGLPRDEPELGEAGIGARIEKLETVQNVVDWIAGIIFTCSCGHSSVNFGQFDYYGFVPNRPLYLTKLMPEDASLVTLDFIMSALPDVDAAEEIIVLARTLTYLEDEGLLAAHRSGELFHSHEQYPEAHNRFVRRLEAIEEHIKARNLRENVFYPYLGPNLVMPSISI